MSDQVDIIAFGAHPDDIEIGCGGYLAKSVGLGYAVGMVDLTRGEMGSNGTVEQRHNEAQAAANILGAKWRENLAIPDRHVTINDDNLAKVVRLIRRHRPKIILAPYWEDRHPDHINASNLITEAYFAAGLKKFVTDLQGYRPAVVLYYILNRTQVQPSFIVDITGYHDKKEAAIIAHESQFQLLKNGWETVLNGGSYLYLLDSRDRYLGALIGGKHGEGFVVKNPIPITDPMKAW